MYRIATDELQNRLRRIEHDRRSFLAPRFASEFDLPDGSRKRMWWQPDIVELTSGDSGQPTCGPFLISSFNPIDSGLKFPTGASPGSGSITRASILCWPQT